MSRSEVKRKTTINPEKWEEIFDEEFAESMQKDGCFDGKTDDIKAFIRILLHSYASWIAQINA